jgi:iron(III) transport system permease protein
VRQALRDNPLLRLSSATTASAGAHLLGLALALLIAATLIWPILLVIGTGFVHKGGLSLYWFERIVSNENLLAQLTTSVLLGGVTTLISLALALPLAMLRSRCRFRGQGLLGVLVLVPMILPPFVGALSMRRLLGQFGTLNLVLEKIGLLDFSRALPPDWLGSGFLGVAVLQSLHLFPILYLNASAALANVDPAYAQAARNLGAGPIRTFFRITLPLIRPGLFAGGTLVFIWSITDVGTPALMGYDQLAPVTIFKELAKDSVSPLTYSLVFVVLIGSIVLYVLGKFLFGRAFSAESSKASVAAEIRPLGVLGTLGAWAVFLFVIGLSLLPHVGVILTAVSAKWVNTILPSAYTWQHLHFVLVRQETFNSILNSVKYAGVSTVVDLALGGLAAWLIVRSRIRGRTLLDGLMMLPLAVPGLILAAGFVAMTAKGTWLESIGPKGNPFVILVVAYSVRRLPFAVRGISAGLEQVPVSLEEAARNLGASRTGAAWRITAPLITANIVAAGVLTFAFAMLEVSDSLILAQVSDFFPITKEIYVKATASNQDALNVASALGVYGMIFLGGTMAVATALLGKRLGAIFRA